MNSISNPKLPFPGEFAKIMNRRTFLARSTTGLGALALASLLNDKLMAADAKSSLHGALRSLDFAPKAKRVIYLFMSGAPSHIDLFDYKPRLKELTNTELPASVRMGQRITGMTSGQKQLLCVGSPFEFKKFGQCGMELSELLPHTSQIADDIALIRSMYTEPINHDPAVTFFATGNQQPGRPTMGAWASYGLGSENQNLPAYIVLLSGSGGQPLQTRYWGSGFLPGNHQGVQFRGSGDPVLYVSNPGGISPQTRRQLLDGVQQLNRLELGQFGDPEVATRIEAYEMAYRMQTSVPELMDISKEPKNVQEMYGIGKEPTDSYGRRCLIARRLVERGVRFAELTPPAIPGANRWDQHDKLKEGHAKMALATDKPIAGLLTDLKSRGLLDQTLVVWAGEFGRTPVAQGTSTGRDHSPYGFSIWLAGGGVKGGVVYGATDEYGFHAIENKVAIHDLHATMLHLLGVDHTRLTYRFGGRDMRLTDIYGEVIEGILV